MQGQKLLQPGGFILKTDFGSMIKCLLRLFIDNLEACCGLQAGESELRSADRQSNHACKSTSRRHFISGFHTDNRAGFQNLVFSSRWNITRSRIIISFSLGSETQFDQFNHQMQFFSLLDHQQ